MKTAAIYSIFNQGEIRNVGCGKRSVILLPPGRKWVVAIDISTLVRIKMLRKKWEALNPVSYETSSNRLLTNIKARLKYVTETVSIKRAIKQIKGG